jgi:hypothetical protein
VLSRGRERLTENPRQACPEKNTAFSAEKAPERSRVLKGRLEFSNTARRLWKPKESHDDELLTYRLTALTFRALMLKSLSQASVSRDALLPTPPGPEGSNGNGLLRVQ